MTLQNLNSLRTNVPKLCTYCLREKSLVADCNTLAIARLISLELLNIRLRLRFDLRPRNYESDALTTRPRTFNKSQTLATNKAENRCYEISTATDRDYSKSATK